MICLQHYMRITNGDTLSVEATYTLMHYGVTYDLIVVAHSMFYRILEMVQ